MLVSATYSTLLYGHSKINELIFYGKKSAPKLFYRIGSRFFVSARLLAEPLRLVSRPITFYLRFAFKLKLAETLTYLYTERLNINTVKAA